MKPSDPKRELPEPRRFHPYQVAPTQEEAQLRRKLLRKLASARISDAGKSPSAKGGSCDSDNERAEAT
jgi:hypothetical protein